MKELLKTFTKFRELLEANDMGYLTDAYNEDNRTIFEVTFGKIGTNYKTFGWVINIPIDNSIQAVQLKAYKEGIRCLEEYAESVK